MDIKTLRVLDVIHGLGITEQEYADLQDELKQDNHSGMYIYCKKKDAYITVIHNETKSPQISISNYFQKNIPDKSRIILNTLIKIKDLPEEIYVLESIRGLHSFKNAIEKTVKDLDSLKNQLRNKFIAQKQFYCGFTEKQLHAIFWLFDENYQEFKSITKTTSDYIARIVKVIELNNNRIAFIHYINRPHESISIECYTPQDIEYDYVDVNREMFLTMNHGGSTNIWLDDELFEKVGPNELAVLANLLSPRIYNKEKWVLLTPELFVQHQASVKIELMAAMRKDQEEQARKNIQEKVDDLFEKEGKVTRKGITYTQNSMECQGVIVKNSGIGNFITRNKIHLKEEPDFGEITESFLYWILRIKTVQNYNYYPVPEPTYKCEFTGKETLQLNKIKMNIENRKDSIYINDRRIPKDDIIEVVTEAAKYTDQKSFDEYLYASSRINRRLQKALQEGGMSFTLEIDCGEDNCLTLKETKMQLTFPLKRVDNKNYTTINGKDYQIQDINAFFDIGKDIETDKLYQYHAGYIDRTIKLLFKAIKGISAADISQLIKDGVPEYFKIQKKIKEENKLKNEKADEFIARAIEISNAKKIPKGYLVKGLSGKMYSINAETRAVYEQKGTGKKKEERYVCLVDQETRVNTDWGRKDALAKRLIMCSQDLRLASEITTFHLAGAARAEA